MHFTALGAVADLEPGATVQTSVRHTSTTGQEIGYLTVAEPTPLVFPPPKTARYRWSTAARIRDIARIDEAGKITAVGGGSTKVTATATVGGVTLTEEIQVSVAGGAASQELASVSLVLAPASIRVGEQAAPQVSGTMTDGLPAFLEDADIQYAYDRAKVSYDPKSGFTGLAAGQAEISVSVTLHSITKTAAATLTILPPSLESVSLSYENSVLIMGATASPTVSGSLSNGEAADLGSAQLAYTSSNREILRVDPATGAATGVSAGSATVTVRAELNGTAQEASYTFRVLTGQLPDSGARLIHNLRTRSASWSPVIGTG